MANKKKKTTTFKSKAKSVGKAATSKPVVMMTGAVVGGVLPAFVAGLLPAKTSKNLVIGGTALLEFLAARYFKKAAPFLYAASAGSMGSLAFNAKTNGLMSGPKRLSAQQLQQLRQGVMRVPAHMAVPARIMNVPTSVGGTQNIGRMNHPVPSENLAWPRR